MLMQTVWKLALTGEGDLMVSVYLATISVGETYGVHIHFIEDVAL